MAERLIEEDQLIAEATGNPPVGYAAMMLAAATLASTLTGILSTVAFARP